jgi:hypothetical protein
MRWLRVRIPAPGPIGTIGQSIFVTERGTDTTVLPAGFTTAITAVTEVLTKMFTLISDIVFPETVTSVSALAAFGLISGLVLWVWSLIKKFSNG